MYAAGRGRTSRHAGIFEVKEQRGRLDRQRKKG